ncbi:MAG: RagB/SusD family nutrient uptake outer membrane protein [Chitinophagaceae bacterium]|jgi:hypothetical protein|nr:RagB/SusD family nutrient uptake outer membrane protein [Chitinophagaceae bacterium]
MNLINKINKAVAALIVLALFASCNKFLDKPPLTAFNDNSFWTSETEVQFFCNAFSPEFHGGGTGTASTLFSNAVNVSTSTNPAGAGLITTATGAESDFYFASFSDDQAYVGDFFPATAPATASTWQTPYIYIRMAQLLLSRINSVPNLSTAQINHYTGYAYFWLAEEYYDLVRHYGDVPFVNKYLDQSQDSSTIWGPRVPRDQVMDSVLNYINLAIANLYSKATADGAQGLGPNTVNVDVANALKSRICLFEGSWAKYHENNTTRATQYFQACQTASEALMNSGLYKLNADFVTVYRTNHTSSTGGMATGGEVILFRKYGTNIISNSVNSYATASTSPATSGVTKDAVESFLLTDGNPISVQGGDPLYMGDTTNNSSTLAIDATVMANRDKRLTETVWPALAYTGQGGNITGSNISTTGYAIQRFAPIGYPAITTVDPSQNDFPVFWYPEILLNEAEALTELGTFTQTNADATVNLLRKRAGVASLDVSNIPVDTKRDADVSPLLWEVRRERRVELMLTSFRYWDIRRWAKLQYLDPTVKPGINLGAHVPSEVDASKVTLSNGYINIVPGGGTNRGIVNIPQDYLDPIPTGQLQLYSNAGITFPQNPGW